MPSSRSPFSAWNEAFPPSRSPPSANTSETPAWSPPAAVAAGLQLPERRPGGPLPLSRCGPGKEDRHRLRRPVEPGGVHDVGPGLEADVPQAAQKLLEGDAEIHAGQVRTCAPVRSSPK